MIQICLGFIRSEEPDHTNVDMSVTERSKTTLRLINFSTVDVHLDFIVCNFSIAFGLVVFLPLKMLKLQLNHIR